MSRALLSLALACAAACATDHARHETLSADEHRREAARNADAAARERALYDPRARQIGRYSDDAKVGAPFEIASTYNPTESHLRSAARLEEHARVHAAAAAELERFEAAECAAIAPRIRAGCPLLQTLATEVLADGIRVFLADPSRTAQTVALMRCHLAWARARAFKNVPDCPLYFPRVDIAEAAGGRAIDVTSRDAETARAIVRSSINER